MLLARADRQIHLTYGTNVHAAENLAEVRALLDGPISQVRSMLGVARLGLGLRLSGVAVRELLERPAEIERLRERSAALGLYHFTLNAFPYGGFHAARVKEQVYEPPWFASERVRYTVDCARVLAALLPAGVARGSISTLAGGFRPGEPSDARARLADHLLRAVSELMRIADEQGCVIAIALEPEPFTTLETIPEVIEFFTRDLFPRAAAVLGDGLLERVRAHCGVCFDACHQAVQFEDPVASMRALAEAGIPVHKVQVSNALEVLDPAARPDALAQLRTFDEPRYLHQATALCGAAGGATGAGAEDRGREVRRWLDLPELFANLHALATARALRVHFHVPLFWTEVAPLGTTQGVMAASVRAALDFSQCNHFEVETYTWDVIPAAHREAAHGGNLVRGLASELEFVRAMLARSGFGAPP
jgi:sugar phosphate isomerase/epimerase